MDIEWKLQPLQIADLTPYDFNARTLSAKEHMHLSESVGKFGLIDKPIVNDNSVIIGGHQRVQVLKDKGFTEVECWVPNVLLDDEQVKELNIRLNRNNGSWDWDILGNSNDICDLLEWGFDEDELGLGKAEKAEKPTKAVISFEFQNKDSMLEYITQCERIAEEAQAKMKVKG